MEQMIKCFRVMGWCWCWAPKKRLKDGYQLESFLSKRLPVFWVMGPPKCGKSTISELLARCSDFLLIKLSQVIKDEALKTDWRGMVLSEFMANNTPVPDEIVLNLLKEIFSSTCEEAIGYILDGFPLNMRQAKQFEFEICKVYIIVYPTLTLDAFLMRMGESTDADELKERHREANVSCQEVYRYYEQKTLKFVNVYPTDVMLNTLVFDLDRYFGYKFRFASDLARPQ